MVSDGQFRHQIVEMQDGPGLQVLDQRRQEIMDLLAAVLQLSRLPDGVKVAVRYLAFHSQEVEYNVGLLDNLNN